MRSLRRLSQVATHLARPGFGDGEAMSGPSEVLHELSAEASKPQTAAPRSLRLVSIVITTRNRAAKLDQTLRSLPNLEVPPGFDYEVVVVDNGSSDDTARVCARFEPPFGGRLRRIFVPTPGKCRACNAGMEAARGGSSLSWMTMSFRTAIGWPSSARSFPPIPSWWQYRVGLSS